MTDSGDISPGVKSWFVGLALCFVLSPIYMLSSHYGQSDKGFIEVCVVGVFCMVAYGKRSSLRRKYLMPCLIVFCLIQVVVVIFIRLPSSFPGAIMLPIAFADMVLIVGIGSFFERM